VGELMQQSRNFFISPFDASGELLGTSHWSLGDLSERWLSFFVNLLEQHGSAFMGPLPSTPLAHISLHLTSAEGATLTTLYAHDHLASSAVALTGLNRTAESQLLRMFVDSTKSQTLAQGGNSREPFVEAFGVLERPLYIVVAWGNPAISEQDQQLVVELNTHLAGALLATGATA
jgi:hypothetical protein